MSADRDPPYCPTAAEVAERQQFVDELHAMHTRESTIKRLFRERFGDVNAATVGRYLHRARADKLAAIGTGRVLMRSESLAFYQRMADDPGVPAKDRIRAQERIDKLLALEMRPDLVATSDVKEYVEASDDPGPLPATDADDGADPPGSADAVPPVGG